MESGAIARHKQRNRRATNRDHRWQLTGPVCVRTGLSVFPSHLGSPSLSEPELVHTLGGIAGREKSVEPGIAHQKPGCEAAEPADRVRPTCTQDTHMKKAHVPSCRLGIYTTQDTCTHACSHPTQPRGVCTYTPCPVARSQPCVYVYMRHQRQLSLRFPAVSLMSGA